MHDDLYRQAYELRADGREWPDIAAELGCTEAAARKMAHHHSATLDAQAATQQFTLFDS